MRLGLLVITLAACSSPAAAGPSWPKATVREVDGGESLAPRAAARAIAAVGEDDKPADKAADGKPAAPATSTGGSTADKPAMTAPAAMAPDDPIMIEDIVIEIDD